MAKNCSVSHRSIGFQHSKTSEVLPSHLGKKDLAQLLSVSIRTVDRYVGEGILPQPMRLGRRLVRWDSGEIRCALSQLAKRR